MEELYRIIDANLNRTREGLRVLEEVARFAKKDVVLTKKLRALRHQISEQIANRIPRVLLLAARTSKEDLGKNFPGEDRSGMKELVIANSLRVSEALRTLEEVTGTIVPGVRTSVQNIRFAFYETEKSFINLYRTGLPDYPVYAIVDPAKSAGDIVSFTQKLLGAGAKIIQLRIKDCPDMRFFQIAQKIQTKAKKSGACFLINDRPDIANSVEADGIHIGQKDLPLPYVRRLCPDKIIGVSTRSAAEAKKAVKEGADYIAVGAIFPTVSKEDSVVVGTRTIREIKKVTEKIPVVAIGGINPKNAGRAFAAGADYVAVISSLTSDQPERVLRELCAGKKCWGTFPERVCERQKDSC
ncbi:MAG: thiamine phosphate synthase [Candidatus Omnitrophota bacterium]